MVDRVVFGDVRKVSEREREKYSPVLTDDYQAQSPEEAVVEEVECDKPSIYIRLYAPPPLLRDHIFMGVRS